MLYFVNMYKNVAFQYEEWKKSRLEYLDSFTSTKRCVIASFGRMFVKIISKNRNLFADTNKQTGLEDSQLIPCY